MTQTAIPIQRLTAAGREVTVDAVAVEAPLEIRVEGRPVAVAMRTPGRDRELAAGFLLSEGVVADRMDVFDISSCPSSQAGADSGGSAAVDVLLTRPEAVDFDRLTRHVFTASSCGLCGKAVVAEVIRRHPPLSDTSRAEVRVPAAVIGSLPDRLRAAQATFATTGGLHACALFDLDGTLIALHEDVGRHNALDKLLGEAWLAGRWPPREVLLGCFIGARAKSTGGPSASGGRYFGPQQPRGGNSHRCGHDVVRIRPRRPDEYLFSSRADRFWSGLLTTMARPFSGPRPVLVRSSSDPRLALV